VLARRIRAALDRALLRQATLALEEKLHSLTAADAALRTQVSSHTVRGPLDPSPLPWPDAVVRLRRHVLDGQDLETGRLERADRRLATGARPLDEDLDLLEAVLHPLACGSVGGHLRGERRRLARSLEAG